MFDFANLLAEYAARVAFWPGLGMSLPIVLLLIAVRGQGRTAVQAYEDEHSVSAVFYLVSSASALVLLAGLPITAPTITLLTFGTLPTGQPLPDSLFSLLLLPLAAAALFTTRGRAVCWLVAALPAMVGLLVVLGSSGNNGWGWSERGLALLACLPLLLISDELICGSWQIRLAGEFGWLATVALLVTALTPSLPPGPLMEGTVLALVATLSAIAARLVNRRWPQLAQQRLLPLSTGAAVLAIFIELIA